MVRVTFMFCSLFFFLVLFHSKVGLAQKNSVVNIGVVQDFESAAGKRNWASISLALDDYYAKNVNDSSRIVLHPKDSMNDVVGAASAVVDLIENNKVQAILGPITSSETKFVTELCNKTRIPIVSFTASSPSLSSVTTPYFVRATLNDTSQVGAIAAVVNYYGWREVVPVYEDTDFGSGIVPSLVDAFNSIDTRVPYRCVVPSNASDEWFEAQLYKLMSMQTRVFVVHMMTNLGKRLFQKAKELNLMNKGYVWITTDSMTNDLHIVGLTSLNSMEGVIGIRSYIPKTNAITDFIARWHTRYARDHPTEVGPKDPTIYQYWAYDALWALATAVEKAGDKLTSTFDPSAGTDNSTDLSRLGVSESGPWFLDVISNVHFLGLAGDFKLVNGQMLSSNFEIVNVLDGHGTGVVGFWSPEVKLVQDLKNVSLTGLRSVIWPGNSKEVPRGWEVPTLGKKLRIGVPIKHGFNEFVNVETDQFTKRVTVTGYCIDIFEAVMSTLPYYIPYEYVPYDTNWYDDLVNQVHTQKYDAVVGDTTIIANRSNYVDFTLPYTESGVSMVVLVKKDDNTNIWIFLQPLTTDLWLASLAFFFFTGFVVWVVEHRINEEFRGPPSQQMGTIFYFAFSTLVFAHKERLESNLSRFTVIIWVFVVLILTSSYTASLTSMLTVQQLQPTSFDLSDIMKKGGYIGIQQGSNVAFGILKKQPNFDINLVKYYNTSQDYSRALKAGSPDGVEAILDEIPYLKVFLSDHCDDYTMVGRIYKTDGFGFVFPLGSPLVPDISRAILNVTEGDRMSSIERKWFGDQTICPTDTPFTSNSLNFRSFGGLFLITGCVSFLALIAFLITFLYKEREELQKAASQTTFWRKIVRWAKHFDGKDLSSRTFKDYATSVNNGGSSPGARVVDVGPSNASEGMQSPISVMSNFTDFTYDENGEEGDGVGHEEDGIEMAEIRVEIVE